MRITTKPFFLLFLIFPAFSGAPAPWGSERAAYRHYFEGSLYFSEGQFDKATNHFQNAYQILPENFTFALAYAACLGYSGKWQQGLSVLQKGSLALSDRDPDYLQKLALRYFFEGVIHAFSGQYGQAVSPIRKGIKIQEQLQNNQTLSVFYNTLGYVLLLDQGQGAHRRADLEAHYHVHRRDMVRSTEWFEQALQQDTSNPAAWYNYHVLCDSLSITPNRAFENLPAKYREITSFNKIPESIFHTLSLDQFDQVIFLLDITGSMVMEKVACMGVTRFQAMKEMTLGLFDQIPPHINLGLGTIDGDCGTTPKSWFAAGALPRKDFRQKLRFLIPDGTTPLLERLKAAPELFIDSTQQKRAIFLVSDGANICSAGGEDICQWADATGRKGITIHILSFLDANLNNTSAFTEYTCLADNTGGRILYIDNYRCRLEQFDFDLVQALQLKLPELQRVECWGPAVKELWAIFPEKKK